MSRGAANFRQSDVARCVRAAKQAGAAAVEVRPDGHILIVLQPPPGGFKFMSEAPKVADGEDEDIVL
ncbi:hypothetical protein [Pleomorphomonas koreensis]|uniref:hypothetical protein n=1 Tax=Pleomorphomonas koreensis TaxID=257440 RepID=UPI000479C010|nr:hypothetical protein [Pleomorphomonas koreensis]